MTGGSLRKQAAEDKKKPPPQKSKAERDAESKRLEEISKGFRGESK